MGCCYRFPAIVCHLVSLLPLKVAGRSPLQVQPAFCMIGVWEVVKHAKPSHLQTTSPFCDQQLHKIAGNTIVHLQICTAEE